MHIHMDWVCSWCPSFALLQTLLQGQRWETFLCFMMSCWVRCIMLINTLTVAGWNCPWMHVCTCSSCTVSRMFSLLLSYVVSVVLISVSYGSMLVSMVLCFFLYCERCWAETLYVCGTDHIFKVTASKFKVTRVTAAEILTPWLLKGFELKLTAILPTLWPPTE